MGGESRAPKRGIKGRGSPDDKDETSTCASAEESRMYAKLILSKVRKLEVELATLSRKCAEPAPGSTSVKAEVVDLEEDEEGNAGGGSHDGGHTKRGGSDDLRRFKTEMEEDCGRLQSELTSLRKLAEVLVDHVTESGFESKKSTTQTPSAAASSSPLVSPANDCATVSDDDDSKSHLGSLKGDANVRSSRGLIKHMQIKKANVGNGRPQPGSLRSSFGDTGDDAEELQEMTEAMQLSENRTCARASKKRRSSRNNSGVTGQQEVVRKTKELARTPAVHKVTPGPSTKSLLLDQPLAANGSTMKIIERDGDNTSNQICGHPELECIFCQKEFLNKSSLERHILSHIGERPYFCNLCPYECTQKGALNQHLEIHKSVRKIFQCDLCPKRYFSKTDLKRHKRQCHTDGKKLKCKVCRKGFRFRDSLTLHVSTVHGKTRPLDTHIRSRTGASPRKCLRTKPNDRKLSGTGNN